MLCKCSSGHIEVSFDIPVQFCTVNSKISWSTFKIDDKSAILKFFSGFFFGRTLTLQFRQTCHYFSIKSPSFSAQSPNNWKKQFFKVRFRQMFPLNTCIAVLAHLDSLFATGQKKLLQIQISNKKHSFSGERIDFPQNFPVDARMAFVTTLKKFFWIKLLFFCLKFQRNLKQCAKFQTCFFPQGFPRLRRLQFWQLWRTFPTEWTEEFAQNPKRLVRFSLFRKDFL